MNATRRFLPGFPEEWLCRLWGDTQLVREPLRTIDGRSVRVLDPGTPNAADGPDFLAATLEIDHAPRRGDVEVHFRSDEWYAHRHDGDPRFANVLIHVVMDHTMPDLCVRHRDAGRIPVVELRSHLRVPLGALALHVRRRPNASPCPMADARPTAGLLRAGLCDLGEVRLLRHAERLRDRIAIVGADQALYEGIADALGYSRNRAPFARTVARVPLTDVAARDVRHAEALLLGAAGLLPSQRGDGSDDDPDPDVGGLERAWRSTDPRPAPINATDWHFSHLHQANAPTRRIVALARIVASTGGALMATLVGLAWTGTPESHWRQRWAAFQVEAGDYWDHHADFGRVMARNANWLVGKDRAADVWVNVALPALIASASVAGDEGLRHRTLELYRAHVPLQSNHKTRWVLEQVLGVPSRDDRTTPAHVQQGMLELHARYCEPRRCADCPLRSGMAHVRRMSA